MRDGIFKSLSMALRWRRFMEACGRPADHGERAVQAAASALRSDVRSEISHSFLAELRSHTSSPQAQLSGLGTALPQWSDISACSPLERAGRLSFARLAEEGVQGRALMESTLLEMMQGRSRQRIRQVEQQVSIKDRFSASSAFREARTATADGAQKVAKELANGGFGEEPKSRRRKIDLDEDLGGGQ